MKDECFCPYCRKSPLSTTNSCERIRTKLAKQRYKERKRNYERKYTLKEFLSGVSER